MDRLLLPLVQCPTCGGEISSSGPATVCRRCQTTFPEPGGIPCLFPEPSKVTAEWRREAQRFVELVEQSVERMDEQLQQADLLPSTRERLARLRDRQAENKERVAGLFRDAGLAPDSRAKASGKEFALIEYYEQVLRDWAWDQEGQTEDAVACQLVADTLGEETRLGKLLVLGTGPCRLAYDLHQRFAPELTVALDLNPFLLLVAQKVMFGGGMKLYEFQPDPVGIGAHSVDHQLRAPQGPPERFFPILADAFQIPLQRGQFDTVLTPWFVDIVPVDLRETLGLIHGLLAPGGRWLMYGPLSYAKEKMHSQRYSQEELYELTRLAGFELGTPRTSTIEYMFSKAAARRKLVDVITFAARKQPLRADPALPAEGPPPWLALPHLPIPRFHGLEKYQREHPMLDYLVDQIDGQRSMNDLAQLMIKDHGARPDAALTGTRAMLGLLLQTLR